MRAHITQGLKQSNEAYLRAHSKEIYILLQGWLFPHLRAHSTEL